MLNSVHGLNLLTLSDVCVYLHATRDKNDKIVLVEFTLCIL